MTTEEKLLLLRKHVEKAIEYLEAEQHNTNVLLLSPPLNAVAYRVRGRLKAALAEVAHE